MTRYIHFAAIPPPYGVSRCQMLIQPSLDHEILHSGSGTSRLDYAKMCLLVISLVSDVSKSRATSWFLAAMILLRKSGASLKEGVYEHSMAISARYMLLRLMARELQQEVSTPAFEFGTQKTGESSLPNLQVSQLTFALGHAKLSCKVIHHS